MWIETVQKTVVDPATGDETLYTFSASAATQEVALRYACTYASMVEYGLVAQKWEPTDMAFPREQLYQFIQPNQLEIIERMYPDAVTTAYQNAMAYVQSYIGAMFDVDTMLATGVLLQQPSRCDWRCVLKRLCIFLHRLRSTPRRLKCTNDR